MERLTSLLAELRKSRGLSRRELAAATGVSEATIGVWESGRRQIGTSAAARLLDALRLSTDERLLVLADMLPHSHSPIDSEAILLALLGRRAEDLASLQAEARSILVRLRDDLGLMNPEIARLVDVKEREVDEWFNGINPLPPSTVGQLLPLKPSLDTLTQLFTRERLPRVLRRRAPLFDGNSAVDLILRGDLAVVAERYDRALQYTA
jgi:transcriptional regulator with XRE-family HTH domain